jgi:hypothetical protein
VFHIGAFLLTPYRGVDGKGVLHYFFGTGEYLDDFSMRKGRIAAGLKAKPLPLWYVQQSQEAGQT